MWRDETYLLDMLLAARKVQRFTLGVSPAQFQRDDILQNAVLHQVQIVGEAARLVSPELRLAHPEIPWPAIVGMRHRLVHDYFRIIPERVWDVVVKDVPALILLLEPLVPPEKADAKD
jgi:uncharacterized protein with HEPN domain